MQLEVASDGVVYVTGDEAPQVSKYQNNQWRDISPPGFIGETFNALSLHPTQPKTLIVSEGEKGRAKIFYSQNGGESWQKKTATIENKAPWLVKEFFNDHPSAIAFDPQNPQQVWLTDWFSVWHTNNITNSSVKWSSRVGGIEQTVLFSLVSPPEGAVLLSGIADQDGFYHQNLTASPQTRFGFQRKGFNKLNLTGDRYLDNFFQDTFHLAYCQNAPNNLVRVGGQRWRNTYMGVTSSDGGKTWQSWANSPQDKLFMRVAIAPNNPQHFLVTTSEDLPYRNSLFDPREDYKFLIRKKEVISEAAAKVGMKRSEYGKPEIEIVDNTTMMELEIEGDTAQEAQQKAIALQTVLEQKIQQLRDGQIGQTDRLAQKFRQVALEKHPQRFWTKENLRLSFAITLMQWFGKQNYLKILGFMQSLRSKLSPAAAIDN